MNGMNPTSLEDRLGFFVAAQPHGYPLLFVAPPDARERADARRRPVRSRVTGLVTALVGRPRPAPAGQPVCIAC
jgi:hypothetical protein